MKIALKNLCLPSPMLFGGRTFNLPITVERYPDLKMHYDDEKNKILLEYKGEVAIMAPPAGYPMVVMTAADAEKMAAKKQIIAAPKKPVKAQVWSPQSHVGRPEI